MLPLTDSGAEEARATPGGFGVYVHWPFCLAKCPYCDFNSHVRDAIEHDDWRDAYLREIEHYAALTGPRRVQSVFFGGGTPSLMEPSVVGAVLEHIARHWTLDADAEITLEANPTSVEAGKFAGFRAAGVNRVSLGVQALNDNDLKALGREHSAAEALAALDVADAHFDRFSFDLIYARPDQSVGDWEAELGRALELAGGHMSLYQLTIEPGTRFHTLHRRGDLQIPGDGVAGEMYELTQAMTAAEGLPAYEISNHAAPEQESRHNLVYWRYGDYAGIGPGAHGRLTLGGDRKATRAHRAPEIWMRRVAEHGHGAHEFEDVAPAQRAEEMLMMGLRLAEGVDAERLCSVGGAGDIYDILDRAGVAAMTRGGFLTVTPDRLVATPAGRQRLDGLLARILG